ncbi:hypothetical protein BT96DRAFT_834161 [Gymnopus androsaceus JB14]|uniref:Tc1-like transposase DDE domain-containing protein n=1 Tax=Gymnopus androsaceus JB14 TaxID=1447944 RepID=A0A6A4GXY2_9AGAR|nr:hypothetical protein BT96DRAFT_834161 [Gymnopus androsaceus JB14]
MHKKIPSRYLRPSQTASEKVAKCFGKGPYYARRLRDEANHLLKTGQILETKQGQGAAHASLLNHHDIRESVLKFARRQLRPAKLVRYVNRFLFPKLGIQSELSERTAFNWLSKVGFNLTKVMKGVYVDGHEREDVVAYRNKFIKIFEEEIFPGDQLEIETPPKLPPGVKAHRVVCQDECCTSANDQCLYEWKEEGAQPLRDKTRGRPIHTSDFVLEGSGYLKLSDEEIAAQKKLPKEPLPPSLNLQFEARKIIYPGANHNPWWDMKQLIAQVKDAIQIFDVKFPNDVGVWIFDCSSAHESFAEDSLRANKMNRGSGGQQPKMHDTIIPSGPFAGQKQAMVFPDDSEEKDEKGVPLAGKPKGMERVLRERGLLEEMEKKGRVVGVCKECKKSQEAKDKAAKEAKARREEMEGPDIDESQEDNDDSDDFYRSKDCCMRRVLELQTDFKEEKPLLQIIIEEAGHKCFFLPKFHCELNPIELVWGNMKRNFREETDGSFAKGKELVPKGLDRISVTTIHRYFLHCYRYMDAYKHGLNVRQAEYAVKKYTSHRRIPATIRVDPESSPCEVPEVCPFMEGTFLIRR